MPELPEVQTIVNDLSKKIIGRRIVDIWFDAPKIITLRLTQGDGEQSRTIKKPKPKDFKKQIKGLRIQEVGRRGKNILIYLTKTKNQKPKTKNYILLIHQKMTGHLLVGKWRIVKNRPVSPLKGPLREKVNDYIHLIFYLDNGYQLALSDLRKFAKVMLGEKEEIEKLPDLAEIGPEPLEASFKVDKFVSLISSQKRKVKQVLMDQAVIAGIGNIYSDEILWDARIHPLRTAQSLKPRELRNLYVAIRQVFKKALKLRGTSISDFRDTAGKAGFYGEKRLVYQREGEKCLRCGEKIKRIKIGGRSTHYCPHCQILK
jgi:formamidopyrimidine-DNA glycosylase